MVHESVCYTGHENTLRAWAWDLNNKNEDFMSGCLSLSDQLVQNLTDTNKQKLKSKHTKKSMSMRPDSHDFSRQSAIQTGL